MATKTDLERRVEGLSKVLLALLAYLAKKDERIPIGVDEWIDFEDILNQKIQDLRKLIDIPNPSRTRGQRRQITLLRKELRTLKALKRLWDRQMGA
jgi:hemerythrin superfamily protein